MPPEWAVYVRLRTAALRRRRCRELFDWSDDEYEAAPARFCDWALAFARAEDEAAMRRAKREADAASRDRSHG